MSAQKGIRDHINADTDVTDLLINKYPMTTGGSQNPIFIGQELPHDAKLPAILINDVTATAFDVRETPGSEWLVDVEVYDDKISNVERLERLAYAVRKSINRATLTIPFHADSCLCITDPPRTLTGPLRFPGRVIVCRVIALEEDV